MLKTKKLKTKKITQLHKDVINASLVHLRLKVRWAIVTLLFLIMTKQSV